MTAATTEGAKTCSQCFATKPIAQFRKQGPRRGGRRAECSQCYRAYRRELRRRKRRERLTDGMKFVAACQEADQISRAASRMIHEFGGIDQFCRLLRETHEEASNRGRVFTSTKLLLAISNIVVAAGELDSRAKSMIPSLSVEEIDVAVRELYGPMITKAARSGKVVS